ncbi:MAG: protein-L-isoaspartate(D-aspartate) O-methyltransferase [Planctomycetota bacterium]|jgi:protein-L-isoaspartate(D-aspartate) O-methyltransferase
MRAVTTLVVAGTLLLTAAQSTRPGEAGQDKPSGPRPPAAAERVEERQNMVERQMAHPTDRRRRVTNEKVLAAMRTAPRHAFVPPESHALAYRDHAFSIGHGQTISQPYIVALMTELLEIKEGDRVLEIGTGSGYQAAVLAHLTREVYTIEIVRQLHHRAAKTLAEQGYDDVQCRRADGYFGWEEHGPFDAIIVTCAAGHLPPPLWQQLAPGGRIVIPIGGPYETQRLVVVTKKHDGTRRSETVLAVRFVPMTGEAQR